MNTLEETFVIVQKDEEIQALRLQNAQLRQVISCALCAYCSEPIADQQWTIDEDELLMHEACLEEAKREKS